MTPEKQLLLKDLCARLPYGVKILQGSVVIETLQSICKIGDNTYTVNPLTDDAYNGFTLEEVKPYLRPMKSMTEEERREYDKLITKCIYDPEAYFFDNYNRLYDYLNAHHLDYRGLIEKGLALEAKEGMYK